MTKQPFGLTDQLPSHMFESTPVSEGGDDVYYHFDGAAICAMLKFRYKESKNCLRTDRNTLSIQIYLLQAMNLKDKSGNPDYLKYLVTRYTVSTFLMVV